MSDLVKQISIKNSSGTDWETRDIGVDADNVEGLIDYINNGGTDTQISNLELTGVTSGNYGSTGTSQYAINGEHNSFTAFGVTLQSDGRASSANNTVYSIDATKKYKLESQESEFSDKNSFFLGEGANDLYNELNGKIFYGTATGTEPYGDTTDIFITVEDNNFQRGLSTGTILIVDFSHNVSAGTLMSNKIDFIVNNGDREQVLYIDSIVFDPIRFDEVVFPFVYHKNGIGSFWKFINAPVTNTSIGALSITADKIAERAVTENKIDNGAVTTDKIANNAVTTGKIANNAILSDKLNTSIQSWTSFGGLSKTIIDGSTTRLQIYDEIDGTVESNRNKFKIINGSYSTTYDTGIAVPAGKGVLYLYFRIAPISGSPIRMLFGVAEDTNNPSTFSRGYTQDLYVTSTNHPSIIMPNGSTFGTTYSDSVRMQIPFNNSASKTYYVFACTNSTEKITIYPAYSYIIFNKEDLS